MATETVTALSGDPLYFVEEEEDQLSQAVV